MEAKLEKTQTPGIYKRGSRYVFRYRDADGIQRWESRGSERLAKAAKAKRTAQAAQGIRPESKITLHEYARRWIDGYTGRTGRGLPDSTREEYRCQLEQYPLRFWTASKLLKDIRPSDVRKLVAWLCDERAHHQALSDATVRGIMAPFQAMMSSANEDGLIVRNPVARVILPNRDAGQVNGDEAAAVQAMTREELDRFLAAVDARWWTFFRLLALTGVRFSEAVGLDWRHVQLAGSTPHIKIRQALVKRSLGAPKSRAGRREVPIPRDLVTALADARRTCEWFRDEDPVFATQVGGRLSESNVRRRVLEPAADTADVPWIGFHTFRHTCASMLIAEGRNIVQVSRWLGHGNPGFTLRTYAHLMGEGVGGPLELGGGAAPEQAEPDSTALGDTTGDHS